jgi:hypothetical protein
MAGLSSWRNLSLAERRKQKPDDGRVTGGIATILDIKLMEQNMMGNSIIRRLILGLIFASCAIAPAFAVTLLNLPITTAVGPAVSQTFQVRPGPGGQWLPATMTVQQQWSLDFAPFG